MHILVELLLIKHLKNTMKPPKISKKLNNWIHLILSLLSIQRRFIKSNILNYVTLDKNKSDYKFIQFIYLIYLRIIIFI